MMALFQCPISGYSHFYASSENIEKMEDKMFQCPISGYSHFYGMHCKGA